MEIKNVEIKPVYGNDKPRHLKPTLIVEIEISYVNSQEIILDVYGDLCINDTILSPIKIDNYGEISETGLTPTFPGRKNNITTAQLKGYTGLDKESLDFIDKNRNIAKNKDVNFSVTLTVSYLENKALTSYVVEYKLNDESAFREDKQSIIQNIKSQYVNTPYEINERDISFLLYARPIKEESYRSNRNNIYLISGNYVGGDKGEYIVHNRITLSFNCAIKSSDWINDYAPTLGIGNYMVLEIPFYKNSDNEIINISLNLIEEAEKAYRAWDATTVLVKCRQAVEKLRNKVHDSSLNVDEKEKFDRLVAKGDKGVFGFLSFGIHEDTNNGDDLAHRIVTQYDAEAALYFTKILVKYTAELLNGDMVR